LSAARDWTHARAEADAFEQLVAREELELEPASRAQLRVARGGEQIEVRDEQASTNQSAELVGREREFALLLEGVEAAQRGRGRHIHLRASAGIGKSRLLLDLHARLRGARTRAALVRCDMGAREIPYAAASEIALALGVLPGARGISPESASALVALAPSLSTWFAVPNDLSTGEEALRRRSLALSELVSAVSDEQALILIVDDVHWMDANSRMILAQMASRVSQHRTLIVTAGRPSAEGRVDAGQAQVIELHPLTEAQCTELVASIAATGATSLPRRFVPELWRATLGSPLHVLEMLHLLRERNLLWVEEGEWRTSSGEQLLQVLRDGGALQRRLGALPRDERGMLVLLAVAGVPSPTEMLAAAGGGGEERTNIWMRNLEQRGLVSRSGNVWELAHDEVGEAAFEHTGVEAVRAAHASLGRWLWQESASDARTMRLAAQHLAQGGETAPLHALFHRFVRLLRSLGDSRALHTLADDMLGRHASAELARGLVSSLPAHVRVGLTSSRRLAAVSMMALVAALFSIFAILVAKRPVPRPPDVELFAYVTDSTGDMRRLSIPILSEQLTTGAEIAADVRKPSAWHISMGRTPALPVESVDEGGVLASIPVADSGTNDLFLLTTSGKKERLTFTPGDDQAPAWSPNGQFIAFETARWRPEDSHYDLALLDRKSHVVRALTSGPASDASPTWNPRGHRVAFLRRYWDGSPTALCSVGFDGGDSTCVAPHGATITGLLAWTDDETVLASLEIDGGGAFGYVRLQDGRFDVVERFASTILYASASSDGRWVVCKCRRIGYEPESWFLVPTDRPALMRPVSIH
ncbi:MAG: AAA family ATPase, partial [Gemmatimonadaceae bacterium]